MDSAPSRSDALARRLAARAHRDPLVAALVAAGVLARAEARALRGLVGALWEALEEAREGARRVREGSAAALAAESDRAHQHATEAAALREAVTALREALVEATSPPAVAARVHRAGFVLARGCELKRLAAVLELKAAENAGVGAVADRLRALAAFSAPETAEALMFAESAEAFDRAQAGAQGGTVADVWHLRPGEHPAVAPAVRAPDGWVARGAP